MAKLTGQEGGPGEGSPNASFTASWKVQLEKDRLAREANEVQQKVVTSSVPELGNPIIRIANWVRSLVKPKSVIHH